MSVAATPPAVHYDLTMPPSKNLWPDNATVQKLKDSWERRPLMLWWCQVMQIMALIQGHIYIFALVNWLLLFPTPVFIAYNTVDRDIFTIKIFRQLLRRWKLKARTQKKKERENFPIYGIKQGRPSQTNQTHWCISTWDRRLKGWRVFLSISLLVCTQTWEPIQHILCQHKDCLLWLQTSACNVHVMFSTLVLKELVRVQVPQC